MKRAACLILSIVMGSATLLFAGAWYQRYWQWRDCFNELGRCYDPESGEVFLEQAGLVWGTFAGGCLLLCLVFVRFALSRR